MDQKRLRTDDLEFILREARPSFERLKSAHLFITGGTGFFGKWLLESLLLANQKLSIDARISILTRSAEGFRRACPRLALDPAVTLMGGDVLSFPDPAHGFTHVIHAATPAGASFVQEKPQALFKTIVHGTSRVLEMAESHGVKRFLNVSSGAVYGPHAQDVSESSPNSPNPQDPTQTYGVAKRAAEHLCRVHASNGPLEVISARCFAFIGPHLPLDAHFAAGNFLNSALKNDPIVVKGDGESLRSYLYMADLAVWLLRLLTDGRSGEAYNVGSEQTVSIRTLAETVGDIAGATVTILGKKVPGTAPHAYTPNTEKIRHELGLKENFQLRDQLLRTLEWHRAGASS